MPNPSGQIASAMNAAIKAARHEIITRIDAHSMLPDGYLQTAVRTLMETGAADVGGWMAAEGVTPFQQAVAWAMTSPFGMGAAANHTGGDAGPADTVYLGVYRREAIEQVGGYDETMLVAEDWELNYRIRAAGGLIWFTPDLKVTYRPRATLDALAKQQFRYGRWRRVVARRYPETVNRRYLAPPAATALNAAGPGPRGGRAIGGLAGAPHPFTYLAFGFVIPSSTSAGVTGVAALFARDLPPASGRGCRWAGRDAHLLGRRVPHRPTPARRGAAYPRQALTRLSASVGAGRAPAATIPQWALIWALSLRPCAGRGMNCTAST